MFSGQFISQVLINRSHTANVLIVNYTIFVMKNKSSYEIFVLARTPLSINITITIDFKYFECKKRGKLPKTVAC